MTNTAWHTIPTAEACDILNFWATASWPMNMDQTISYASKLGWTAEKDEDEAYLVNEPAGLTIPDVDTPVMPSGDIASITFYLTDVTRELTDEATTFLNDQFALYYRAAATRWGDGTQSTLDSSGQAVEWELGGDKGRITLMRNAKSITTSFDTPQYAKVLRELGE